MKTTNFRHFIFVSKTSIYFNSFVSVKRDESSPNVTHLEQQYTIIYTVGKPLIMLDILLS